MKRLLAIIGDYKRIFLILIMVILIIINILLIYKHYFKIKFEEVYRESYIVSEDSIIWHSTRAETLSNSGCNNKEIFSVDFNDYNFEKYTYVICYGHELVDLSYSFSEIKNSNGLYFIPRAVLKMEKKDMVYIYRLKKINIDYDMHELDRNVYFK